MRRRWLTFPRDWNTSYLRSMMLTVRQFAELAKFRSDLEPLLPSPYSRPFVCDGSPLNCRIFIVGTNSAKLFHEPFFSFWDPSYGFKKDDFLRKLYELPGGASPTRRNIEIVTR